MGQLNAANTSYPASLDTATTLTDGASGDQIVAQHQNGPASAIIAIETELGTDPAGSATDLATRLTTSMNQAGAITLGTAASTVGVLPFNRGGLGLTVASATPQLGQTILWGGGSNWQVASLTAGSNITITPGSGSVTIALSGTVSGTVSSGTLLTKNPIATSSTTVQAHGLGSTPTWCQTYLEAVARDLSFATGTRIFISDSTVLGDAADQKGFQVKADATNVTLLMGAVLPTVLDQTNGGAFTLTAAQWKAEVRPFLLN